MKTARSLGLLLIVVLFTNQPAAGQTASGDSEVIHVTAEIQPGTSVTVVHHSNQSFNYSETEAGISGWRGMDQQVQLPHGNRILWDVQGNVSTAEPTTRQLDARIQPEFNTVYQEVLISVARKDHPTINKQAGKNQRYVATIHYF
ncbi:MAG: hypothetical protein GVY07_14705 [Bacteroidetes bacterium]|jgi:hypothetical protein|nr:hypothetical protein [Bacteroidota bacterium]